MRFFDRISLFAFFFFCTVTGLFCADHTSAAAPPKKASDAAAAPQVVESVVRIDSGGNFSGTGVVVTPEGHVVTNTRTVTGYPYATFTVGTARIKAAVVLIDQKHDLAVLKAETPLPRWATLETAAGPSKDEPVRLYAFNYRGSDPPMIDFKSAPFKVDDPHYKGESAGTMDLSDLLIVRLAATNADFRTDGAPVFSSKNGRLLGVAIGKLDPTTSALVAMPASSVRALLVSKGISVPAAE
jgi:hypothetical protein